MTHSRRNGSLLALAVVAALAGPRPAAADVPLCRIALTKATQQFVAAKTRALQRCEDQKITGGFPPSTVCRSESGTAFKIGHAAAKARAAIVRRCCGQDGICGNAGDDLLSAMGWGATAQCPNFEDGQLGNCANAIDDPGDVADCLLCVGNAATDELIDLLYATRTSTEDRGLERCQRAIGQATARYVQAKSKAVEKCWERRIRGQHTFECPFPGDGKAGTALAKALAKKTHLICKACGGSDGGCDGVSDYTASDIGFPANCPDVTVPDHGGYHAGENCARPVTTLADVVHCLDCVGEYKTDCVDDLAVREFETYVCGGTGPTPTPGGPTPTAPTPTRTPTPMGTPGIDCGNGTLDAGEACDPTAPAAGQACDPSICIPLGLPLGAGAEFACTCATGSERTTYAQGRLDNGWTGTSQGTRTVAPTVVDLLLFDCNGTSDPLCQIYGPRPGPYGFRCETNARQVCNVDADCGGNGRCGQFLGPPLPLSSGNVPVCVTSFFDRPTSGTLNVSTGTTESASYLKAIVHLASAIDAPCARCNCSAPLCLNQVGDAGTCSGGAAVGQTCTIEGTSDFGPVSNDCPPIASTNISGSGLDIRFLPTTTGQSTLDVGVPCTDPTAAGLMCPCDTCGGGPTPDAPCNSDAQCGPGGVCGAKRCTQGGNAGQICATDAECPPGTPGSCGRPGLASKPNGCSLGCDGGTNNNQPCTSNADCTGGVCIPLCHQFAGEQIGQGQCILGPTRGECSVESFRGCQTNLDCNPPPLGSCLTCQLGQTCVFANIPCHVFPIQLQGQAGAFSSGTSTGESVNSFCIPPTSSQAVNQTSGIPGEGVIIVPHTLTVQFPAVPQ